MIRKRHRSDQRQQDHKRHEYKNSDDKKIELIHQGGEAPNGRVTPLILRGILNFSCLAFLLWRWHSPSSFTNSDGSIPLKVVRDDCGCFPHDGTGARIAYLITLHNERTLNDGLELVKSIAATGNIILIHVDRKLGMQDYERSDLNEFIGSQSECRACGAKVLVDSKFDLEWGKWSMNDPTHWGMSQLVFNPRFVDQWDVFINLSADTMPVYTPQVLSNFFDPIGDIRKGRGFLHDINFVTSSSCATGLIPTNISIYPFWLHKRVHYESMGDFDITYVDETGVEKSERLEIHFGSQWMILTPDFVRFLALSMRREDSLVSMFKKELIARDFLMSDETFVPTILSNHAEFSQTMPELEEDYSLKIQQSGIGMKIHSIRYERMDEHKPDAFGNVVDDQRYDVPESSTMSAPREWGPYFLGVYDLGNIKNSGALFIRKVAKDVDPNLFNILPVSHSDEIPHIHWPEELKVSEKVDWKQILVDWKHQTQLLEHLKSMRED